MLADVSNKFRNMFLEIYGLNPAHFLKNKVKLDLLTDIDMLLMIKNVPEMEYVMLFNDRRKLIINT